MEKNLTKQSFQNQNNNLAETNFSSIKITLASPEKIKSWSFGEIKNLKQLIIELLDQKKMDYFVRESLDLSKTMSVCVANIKE